MNNSYENELKEWISSEKLALELTQAVSYLQFERSVELVLFRRRIFDKRISEIKFLRLQMWRNWILSLEQQLS